MASIQNPDQAVPTEAAATHQECEHKGQRGGVRHAGGASRANGLTLSEWVRDVLLSAPAEPGAEAGEVVLAELLALRSLFLNLQFRTGQGPLTEGEMRGLIERADSVKMQRARQRLEAVRTEAGKANGETNPKES